MHEFDKVTMMKGLQDLLSLYKEVKPHMADVVDDHKLMTAAHAGMVELAAYHLARAAGEIEKLIADWSVNNDTK